MVNYIPKHLALVMTDRCNATCRFCGHEKTGYQDLSNEDMLNCIEQAHDLDMKRVLFSGGEPTLRYEDLLQGIRYANSKGMETQIVTNASYAIDEERGRQVAKEFEEAGLKWIVFSLDKDHQDYIPYISVLNATKGALSTNMNTRFKTHFRKSIVKDNFSLLLNLAKDLGGKHEFEGKGSVDGKITVGNKVLPVEQRYIVRSGEAKKIKKSEFRARYKIKDYERCCTEDMVVKTNGDITPCLGFEAFPYNFYVVGNVADTSLRTAAVRVNESITDMMLSPYSFFRIKSFLEKSGNEKAKKMPNKRYSTFCEYCVGVFSKPDLKEQIVEEFNKFRRVKPEVMFEKDIGPARKAKVIVDGKEINLSDYLGPLSYKDFYTKYCEHILNSLEDKKEKRAIRDKKLFEKQLKIVSEMENAEY